MILGENCTIPRPHNVNWKKIRALGSGGQGSTYIAVNEKYQDGKECVLKELNDPRDEQALRRFENEIGIIRKIDHPSIIKIIDYSIEDGPPFYVMEYHEGARTLEDVILTQDEEANPYNGDVLKCLDLFEKIILALRVCGFQDPPVIHRDINPQNILLLKNGDIVLIDFGLSYTVGDTTITLSGQNIGARSYAPPECGAGSQLKVSTASDIYSAAKVLWSAITSERAFDREIPIFENKSMERMFFRKEETWHLNRIFEQTIQYHPSNRIDSAEILLAQIESLRQIISKGFPPLEAVASKCPSCGHWSVVEFFPQDNETATAFVREGFLTYECNKCGFAFARRAKTLKKSLTQFRQ